MALFGKIFGKETCAICGAEVGALKKKKVADGVICKDCAAKCSPWFDGFKETPAASIKQQIEYRETANKELLLAFQATKVFGEYGVVLIDENMQAFCAVADTSEGLFGSPKKVTSIDDVRELNPDVISLSEVKDVDIEIKEMTHEQKQTVDGQQVSYEPKRMTYDYMYTLIMHTSNPFAPCIRVQLNNGAVQIKNEGERLHADLGRKLAAWLLDTPQLDVQNAAEVYDDDSLMAWITRGDWEMPDYAYGFKCTSGNWEEIQRYSYYLAMAGALRTALMQEIGA